MPIDKTELFQIDKDEISSDSDIDSAGFTPDPDHGYIESVERLRARDRIIHQINSDLRAGRQVDLSRYPPLFIVHFRGIHFFGQFFNQSQRREINNRIRANQFNVGTYSPAVYELAGLNLAEPIDTNEKKRRVKQAICLLKGQFDRLAKERGGKAWYGDKSHENLLYGHYQRYVNDYADFRQEAQEKIHRCYQILEPRHNPYLSTADEITHAIKYALGGKSEMGHGSLRPGYHVDPSGRFRAKHPKVGYVQVFFHTIGSIKRNNPMLLSSLHAAGKISIGTRLLNERESTFKAWIASKHLVLTKTVRFPSQETQRGHHISKYGHKFARLFSEMKRETTRKSGILDKLAEIYATQLMNKVNKIAHDRKGFIVYLGLDGQLRSTLPTTQDISTFRRSRAQFDVYKTLELYKPPDSDSEEEFREEEAFSQLGTAGTFEQKLTVPILEKAPLIPDKPVSISPKPSLPLPQPFSSSGLSTTSKYVCRNCKNEQNSTNSRGTCDRCGKPLFSQSVPAPLEQRSASRSPRSAVLALDVSRKGLFREDHPKHQEAKRYFEKQLSTKHITPGQSTDNGDCFFDALAQGLNAVGIKKADGKPHTDKSLRLICHRYANDLNGKAGFDNWVESKVEADKHTGQSYRYYLQNIDKTVLEIGTGVIWGRPHVDGQILATYLNMAIHLQDLFYVEGNLTIEHKIIDKKGSRTVSEGEAYALTDKVIRLANYEGALHYVPLMKG